MREGCSNASHKPLPGSMSSFSATVPKCRSRSSSTVGRLVLLGEEPGAGDRRGRRPDAAAAADKDDNLSEPGAGAAPVGRRRCSRADGERLAADRLDKIIGGAGARSDRGNRPTSLTVPSATIFSSAPPTARAALSTAIGAGESRQIDQQDARRRRPRASAAAPHRASLRACSSSSICRSRMMPLDAVERRLIRQDGDDARRDRALGRSGGGADCGWSRLSWLRAGGTAPEPPPAAGAARPARGAAIGPIGAAVGSWTLPVR